MYLLLSGINLEVMLASNDVGVGVPGVAAVGRGEDSALRKDGATAEVEVSLCLPAHLKQRTTQD